MINYNLVSKEIFFVEFARAWRTSEAIRANCCRIQDIDTFGVKFYLSEDGQSGYGVRSDVCQGGIFNLNSVFSLIKGRGRELVKSAIDNKANSLDCFDGFLVDFYKSLGFIEYKRSPNWIEGEADVVFMVRPRNMYRWAARRNAQFKANNNKLQ